MEKTFFLKKKKEKVGRPFEKDGKFETSLLFSSCFHIRRCQHTPPKEAPFTQKAIQPTVSSVRPSTSNDMSLQTRESQLGNSQREKGITPSFGNVAPYGISRIE